jgi:signal transduction histidine kinase
MTSDVRIDGEVLEKARILIVEDERITSDHLRRLLTRLGYEVVGIAANGVAALEQLQEAQPDLVVADVELPGEIDGVEVATRARKEHDIPVVFLTAFSDPETIRRARVPEPHGFVVKPFAEEELHATIEIALQQSALRKRRAHEALTTTSILAGTKEELRAVTARLFRVQEEERTQIARDLHDDINHEVALLQVAVETLWQKLAPQFRTDHRAELDRILTDLESLSRHLRDISHRLHPSILDDLGLAAALRSLAETFEERTDIPVRFIVRTVPERFSREISLAVYRIAQEALHNITKHAGDNVTVTIALEAPDGKLELTIRDSGVGFSAGRLSSPNGLGLKSMAERAELLGGKLAVDSDPGHGTRLHVRIPLETESGKGDDTPRTS